MSKTTCLTSDVHVNVAGAVKNRESDHHNRTRAPTPKKVGRKPSAVRGKPVAVSSLKDGGR